MYADRHARPEGIKPGSLAVAVGINAGLIAALLLANPDLVPRPPEDRLTTVDVPIAAPPPPEPQPTPEAKRASEQPRPTPPALPDLSSQPSADAIFRYPPLPPLPPLPDPGPTASGDGATKVDPLPAVPVGAVADPRFARDLQPSYPAAERRLEREGRVRLRVLIGVDGRVKQVERVEATSDAFFQATERQALAKWRFKPATRDGIPQESWKVMTVTFRLEQ